LVTAENWGEKNLRGCEEEKMGNGGERKIHLPYFKIKHRLKARPELGYTQDLPFKASVSKK